MITSEQAEKDLDLKLRSMRLLWHWGYAVRRNVDIGRYVEGRRETPYTDIDVLGTKIHPDLTVSRVLIDCTTETGVGTPEKLFWLSGLIRFTGADYAIFLRRQMLEAKYIDLAGVMGALPLSEPQLGYLEKSYRVPVDRFFGAFSRSASGVEEAFTILRKFDREMYEYILYQHWWDPPHQRVLTLASICRRIAQNKAAFGKWVDFLCSYGLSVLSLGALEFARPILAISEDRRPEEIVADLLGGRLQAYERRKLIASFYDFMTAEIRERYKQKYPVSRKQFVESLAPDYSKYFVDFVLRICDDPGAASFMTRVLDLFAYEVALGQGKFAISDILSELSSRSGSEILKPAKDAFDFAFRSGLVTQELFEEFNTSVKALA